MNKKINLSYIAGLFDGEGSIWIYPRKESGKIRIQISITNTDMDVLNFVKEFIGLGQVFKNRDNRNIIPVHGWQTSDGHAYLFLKKILPYLHIKKIKAKEALKKYESNKWNRIKFIET